jgi:Ca-activated chloride channel homolog
MVDALLNWQTATAAGVFALVLVADFLHSFRVRRVAPLAFGPTRRPRVWVYLVPPARALACAALCWGLLTLYVISPKAVGMKQLQDKELKRLMIVLDVSPSMDLTDAGPTLSQTRAKRAADLVTSILDRIILDQTRVSVVAVYNGAFPVVIDTRDPAIIRNILRDLPLDYAFDHGKTKLLDGIREACNIARPWRENSTTLLLVSDGDTVPDAGMPELPRSINKTLVLGVGDPKGGKFIDGHTSRQDMTTLRQLATRLRGVYHEGNAKHLASETITDLATAIPMKGDERLGRREIALAAVTVGSVSLTLIPMALAVAGTGWQVGRRGRAAIVVPRPPELAMMSPVQTT